MTLLGPPNISFYSKNVEFWARIDSQAYGSVQRVDFTDPAYGTRTPASDNTAYFQTYFTPDGTGFGTTSMTANAYMDATSTVRCSSTKTFNVNEPLGWFQAAGSFIISETGTIRSVLPTTSDYLVEPVVNILSSASAIWGGSGNIFTGQGQVSDTNRKAQTSTTPLQSGEYTYETFENMIPGSITPTVISSIYTASGFNSGGANFEGYSYYRRTGDLTLSGAVALNNARKVVLFVDGTLTINGNITYGTSNTRNVLFMVIARNININPAVTNLSGIYFSEGNINTGSGNQQLTVFGSMVGASVNLERNLGVNNASTPAELFNYDANIFQKYPRSLTPTEIIWREVAPVSSGSE